MNKKGFAISTMLYGLIFLTIAIFYIIINVVSDRYVVNNDFVDKVRKGLNVVDVNNNVCEVGMKLGTCLYNERGKLGLWSSGLENDEIHQNVRYIGTKSNEPNNYICIGSNTDCTGYHLHRIIGVFETNHQVKVIYPKVIGNHYYYPTTYSKLDYKYTNNHQGIRSKVANLLTNKNLGYDTYITGTTKWSDMMQKMTYNQVRGHLKFKSSSETWLNDYYAENYQYTNRIVLTSPADMLLSTGRTDISFYSQPEKGKPNTVVTESWLYSPKREWIADQWSTSFGYFIAGSDDDNKAGGKLCGNSSKLNDDDGTEYCAGCSYTGYTSDSDWRGKQGYRANFQLISETLYCGGTGTEEDPYRIGFETC